MKSYRIEIKTPKGTSNVWVNAANPAAASAEYARLNGKFPPDAIVTIDEKPITESFFKQL